MQKNHWKDILGKFDEEEIELRSEEVQEILSRPPGILVRWGIASFFVIILLIFIGGCFFRYPDIVSADITITTEYPPVWMVSRSAGKLKEILFKDKQQVRQGDVIAVMENTAISNDILTLKNILKKNVIMDSCICEVSFPEKLILGNVQSSYNTFMKALVNYTNFLRLDLYKEKELATRKELDEYRVYIGHLRRQDNFSNEQLKIAEISYKREELLKKRNIISEANLEEAHQTYLSHKQAAEQLKISLSSARIQEAQLEQNIVEIQMERHKEANSLFVSLKNAYDELLVFINNWELTYLFISPADGVLSYQHIWQENQEIAINEKVFSIIAEHPGDIIGKISLPSTGIGKVKIGQRINIRITGYPYMEYGYLMGKVSSISMLANENKYSATVSLSQNLITSYNHKLVFTGEFDGIAEIVTDERSLTSRIFSPLRYLWKKHF